MSRTCWGWRKPWIACGVPLLVAMTWVLCAPPAGTGTGCLLAAAVAFHLCLTLVQIRYLSQGAELPPEYAEGTCINGLREGGGMLGTVRPTMLPLAPGAAARPPHRRRAPGRAAPGAAAGGVHRAEADPAAAHLRRRHPNLQVHPRNAHPIGCGPFRLVGFKPGEMTPLGATRGHVSRNPERCRPVA